MQDVEVHWGTTPQCMTSVKSGQSTVQPLVHLGQGDLSAKAVGGMQTLRSDSDTGVRGQQWWPPRAVTRLIRNLGLSEVPLA